MDTKGETFFHSQLATSMDIDCWSCLDWVHGGLQFHAIHHLFPRLPRHRLRALVPVVRALANKHGADYHVRSPRARACACGVEIASHADSARASSVARTPSQMTTFWQANVELVNTLRRTAGESTTFNAGVWEALNASG
jgi:hypothetical protein